jgi:hypothetical protein
LEGLSLVLLAGLGLLAAGCHGQARLELAAIDYRSIDPPAARIVRLSPSRCYWWTDEQGRVWIAMQYERRTLLGRLGHLQFQLSLLLEQPPAGKARNYNVDNCTLRAVARAGPTEGRFTSVTGIVALYREPNDRFRGSLRILADRQASRLLGGWGKSARFLILGSFTAVHDEQRGREIADLTESRGWERNTPAPATDDPGEPPAASAAPGPINENHANDAPPP